MFDCISYNVTFDYYEILVLMDYLLKKTILCKTSLYITAILIITKILLKVALITISLNSLYNDIYFIIFKGESASSKKKVDTFGQNDADWDVYKEIVRFGSS
jgi:hypothetical protein